MSGKQAKILHDRQIDDLLVFASATRNPLRNKLIVLLSVKAGLRAGEIAGLTWDMVLDPTGEVGHAIELHDCIAKKNSGRRIPVNPALRTALTAWCLLTGGTGPVIRSEHGAAMSPVSIVNWFAGAYRAVGLAGCSSHSGRRTSSPGPPGSFTSPAARCATFSFSLVIGQFRRPSGTSTGTPTPSESWWR
jgi:integrase